MNEVFVCAPVFVCSTRQSASAGCGGKCVCAPRNKGMAITYSTDLIEVVPSTICSSCSLWSDLEHLFCDGRGDCNEVTHLFTTPSVFYCATWHSLYGVVKEKKTCPYPTIILTCLPRWLNTVYNGSVRPLFHSMFLNPRNRVHVYQTVRPERPSWCHLWGSCDSMLLNVVNMCVTKASRSSSAKSNPHHFIPIPAKSAGAPYILVSHRTNHWNAKKKKKKIADMAIMFIHTWAHTNSPQGSCILYMIRNTLTPISADTSFCTNYMARHR